MKKTMLPVFCLLPCLLLPVTVLAGDGGHEHRRQPGPPPEALAACKGKQAGAATSLTTPDGQAIKGVCELVFRPESAPAERASGDKRDQRPGK